MKRYGDNYYVEMIPEEIIWQIENPPMFIYKHRDSSEYTRQQPLLIDCRVFYSSVLKGLIHEEI